MKKRFFARDLIVAFSFVSMAAFAESGDSNALASTPRSMGPEYGRLSCASPPTYPPGALRTETTGISVLHVLLAPDGTLLDVRLLRPSGTTRENSLLDDAAVEAARKCHYVLSGTTSTADRVWAVVSFAWKLEGDEGNPFSTGPLSALRDRATQGDATSAFWVYLRSGFDDAATKDALHWLQFAAEHGMVRAQFELGRLYNLGDGGVPRDGNQAAKWLQRASDGRDLRATMALAHLLLESDGPPRDPSRAVELLRHAATDDKLASAMLLLGDVEAAGTAVERDDKAAFTWWHRAAEANSVVGFLRVGTAWESGTGVRGIDRTLAATYYLMAQRSGSHEANARLAGLHADEEVLAEARKKVSKWDLDGHRLLPD
jgi:TonB family protein